jgi:hypothetical protein
VRRGGFLAPFKMKCAKLKMYVILIIDGLMSKAKDFEVVNRSSLKLFAPSKMHSTWTKPQPDIRLLA